MEAWLARPNRRTPFPWPDEEYVVPSNQFDLDYYAGRPDAFPPGVREWRERFDSYVYDGPVQSPRGRHVRCMLPPMSVVQM